MSPVLLEVLFSLHAMGMVGGMAFIMPAFEQLSKPEDWPPAYHPASST
jgi:hypothetical protein